MPSFPKSRVTYRASYPDPLGRIVATADFGTNGGVELERPDLIPARSATVRVMSTAYDAAGMGVGTTDPGGRVDEKTFDDAGRLTQTVENKKESGSSSSSGLANDDENRTTDYEYNRDGKMTKLIARNYVTGDQVTEWIYGVDFTASGGLASNALLREKSYPDSTGSSDRVRYEYNRLGEVTQQTDQAGTNHAFLYDKLGRLLHDCVTLPQGSDIDDTVLRITRAYNARGLPDSISSWDDATPEQGNCLNEVTRAYNDFGQLTEEKQSHSGQATGATPAVLYSYEQDETTPIPNTTRLRSVTYPNARQLAISYGEAESMDNILSRVSGLADSQELVHYTYLGVGQVVRVEYTEPGIELTYLKQDGEDDGEAGDQYAGLDRFGRIVDQRWLKQPDSSSSSSPEEDALERVKFTYDQAGNIVTRQNLVAPGGQDEVYEYDGLYQLTRFARGTLNSQLSALNTPPDWQEALTFDPLGNWKRYQTDDGANPLDQTRTHNPANELTGITTEEGPAWVAPAHDAVGNMIECPQPADPTSSYDLKWDAWNRLVRVNDGETVVAEYGYDGLTRRITKAVGGTTRHYYYNSSWQVLEERVGTSTAAERQWVWGILRLDDPVCRDRDTDQDEELDERLYALADHLSPRALVDAEGVVQERLAYDAFGNTRVLDEDWEAVGASEFGWEVRLHGYRWDGETGLYHVRFRYLHSGLGRWVSRDPIGEGEGANLHGFVGNRPQTYDDSYGLFYGNPVSGLGGPVGPSTPPSSYWMPGIDQPPTHYPWQPVPSEVAKCCGTAEIQVGLSMLNQLYAQATSVITSMGVSPVPMGQTGATCVNSSGVILNSMLASGKFPKCWHCRTEGARGPFGLGQHVVIMCRSYARDPAHIPHDVVFDWWGDTTNGTTNSGGPPNPFYNAYPVTSGNGTGVIFDYPYYTDCTGQMYQLWPGNPKPIGPPLWNILSPSPK